MEKILLISNMYPSKKYKHYGVFVQNTASILKNNGYQVDVSALKKKDSKLGKLGGYLSFYLKSIFLCLFHHYDYLYAHYISHCALLIKMSAKGLIVPTRGETGNYFMEMTLFQKTHMMRSLFL